MVGAARVKMTPHRQACHTASLDLDELSESERAWLEKSEALWARAYKIVSERPKLDAGDVYHALCNLERTPTERLRRSLARAQLRLYRV